MPIEENQNPPLPEDVTQLLQQWGSGDRSALDELLPMVYDELRGVARSYIRREGGAHTLQATALVNEMYMRMMNKQISFSDREHFFRTACRMMRRILVEYARYKQAGKRGGGPLKTLDDALEFSSSSSLDLPAILSIDKVLTSMENRHPRLERIVEMRVFAGLNNEEIAAVLSISLATVKREWRVAKQRLFLALKGIS